MLELCTKRLVCLLKQDYEATDDFKRFSMLCDYLEVQRAFTSKSGRSSSSVQAMIFFGDMVICGRPWKLQKAAAEWGRDLLPILWSHISGRLSRASSGAFDLSGAGGPCALALSTLSGNNEVWQLDICKTRCRVDPVRRATCSGHRDVW